METPRSDAPLIRHLAKTRGLETARDWQRPPLVLLLAEGFVRYLFEHDAELYAGAPTLDALPWTDVVLDFPRGRSDSAATVLHHLDTSLDALQTRLDRGAPDVVEAMGMERGRCWIRVRDLASYRRRLPTSSPWMTGGHDLLTAWSGEDDRYLAVEVWEEATLHRDGMRGFPLYPDVSIIDRCRPWDYDAIGHLYPNPACRSGRAFGDGRGFCNLARCQWPDGHPVKIPCVSSALLMVTGVLMALLTFAYLVQADEHLVEVRPAAGAGRERGDGSPKPWTRTDLPHVILLDPTRAREYGRPATAGEGTHAAPRPHGRRGH